MPTRRAKPRAQGVIHTRELTKDFGSVRAVDSLDLDVERGEVFGYLGPNGAGKTTTIRLVLDFVRPTQGSVHVLGGSGGEPDVRRHIGYLPFQMRDHQTYRPRDVDDCQAWLQGA